MLGQPDGNRAFMSFNALICSSDVLICSPSGAEAEASVDMDVSPLHFVAFWLHFTPTFQP